MSKFKVLDANQKLMAPLGIYPKDLNAPTNRLFNSIAAYHNFFVVITFTITLSALFVCHNTSNLLVSLEAVFIVAGGLQQVGMFLSVGINIDKVKTVHLEFEKLVVKADENHHSDVLEIYWKTEEKCRKFTRFLSYYLIFNQIVHLASVIYSIYNICIGNFDTSTWILALHLYFPFDMSSIFRWYIQWFIQINITVTYSLTMVVVSAYFVCCCLYIGAISNHFGHLIRSANNDVECIQMTKSNPNCQQLRRQAREKVSQAVEIHVTLFEIFKLIADINSGAIFVLLPTNAIFQACSMYNTEHSPLDATSLIWHGATIFASLLWSFLFCHFASFATGRISSIGDVVYTTEWYNFPLDVQKYFILTIARSQEPVDFTGLNLIRCNIEIFGKLFRTSCSYYLIFRNLSKR